MTQALQAPKVQKPRKVEETAANRAMWIGIIVSFAFTGIIWLVRPLLPQIEFAPDTGVAHYLWKLPNPTAWTRASAWGGYLLHQVVLWGLIYYAQRKRPTYTRGLHRFNIIALALNAFFVLLHLLQTAVFYDGLAQDVSIFSSQGSVILMLVMILLMENQRRGLFFGKKIGFLKETGRIARRYHGYIFAWAIVYTFWYHPMENSMGHLLGFLYTFLLLLQGSLFFTRTHVNRYWMIVQEVTVLFHGTIVAVYQGNNIWPMFFFGFAALFVVTQMHGLGLSRAWRWTFIIAYVGGVLLVYSGRGWGMINEIVRIPVIEYGLVFVLALLIWLGARGVALLSRLRGRAAGSPLASAD